MALITFCILRHKRRRLKKRLQVAPDTMLPVPTDPFQDSEVENQAAAAPGAENSLKRLQELAREAEEELRDLGNRARSEGLSDSERERLDEISRTTGWTT